jgi:hypothetical protein
LIYRLVRWGQPYVDPGGEAAKKRYLEARINRIRATAADLGYNLVPHSATA